MQTGLFNVTTANAGVFESGTIRSDGTLWLWGDQITDPTLQISYRAEPAGRHHHAGQ